MRAEPDQRSHGYFNANRPTQPRRAPENNLLLDSHGPAERVRGSAFQISERYLALAREAERSNDRVISENYYQHAEHYFRIDNLDNDGDATTASHRINRSTGELALASDRTK